MVFCSFITKSGLRAAWWWVILNWKCLFATWRLSFPRNLRLLTWLSSTFSIYMSPLHFGHKPSLSKMPLTVSASAFWHVILCNLPSVNEVCLVRHRKLHLNNSSWTTPSSPFFLVTNSIFHPARKIVLGRYRSVLRFGPCLFQSVFESWFLYVFICIAVEITDVYVLYKHWNSKTSLWFFCVSRTRWRLENSISHMLGGHNWLTWPRKNEIIDTNGHK